MGFVNYSSSPVYLIDYLNKSNLLYLILKSQSARYLILRLVLNLSTQIV